MKTEKLCFYSQHVFSNLLPRALYRKRLLTELERIQTYDRSEIETRVNYYLKPKTPFRLNFNDTFQSKEFRLKNNKSAYFFDLLSSLRYFPDELRFSYLFGDIRHVPDQPSFVKSRPIGSDNKNSVLLKLNSVRHFNFIHDPYRFEDKQDIAIFRGACHQSKRQAFLQSCQGMPNTDIGDTRKQAQGSTKYRAPISIREHMKCKFIISVEGNDVASNLKWILNSNSLCFMTRPQYETWFMEGTLIPNHHYVLLNEDYSDLPEKIDYYRHHQSEARHIIHNAQQYTRQFQDARKEKLLSLMVMKRYFSLSQYYDPARSFKRPVTQNRPVLPPALSRLTD